MSQNIIRYLGALQSGLARLILRAPGMRRRLAFEIKNRYFQDLKLSLGVEEGLTCPIHAEENMYSFTEIFVEREYAGLLDQIPAPMRWLDIGAHAGYFTLFAAAWNAKLGRRDGWSAVLVEPDPRMLPVIEAGFDLNGFSGRMKVLAGAISAGGREIQPFVLRSGMESSSIRAWAAECERFRFR